MPLPEAGPVRRWMHFALGHVIVKPHRILVHQAVEVVGCHHSGNSDVCSVVNVREDLRNESGKPYCEVLYCKRLLTRRYYCAADLYLTFGL